MAAGIKAITFQFKDTPKSPTKVAGLTSLSFVIEPKTVEVEAWLWNGVSYEAIQNIEVEVILDGVPFFLTTDTEGKAKLDFPNASFAANLLSVPVGAVVYQQHFTMQAKSQNKLVFTFLPEALANRQLSWQVL